MLFKGLAFKLGLKESSVELDALLSPEETYRYPCSKNHHPHQNNDRGGFVRE